MLAELPEVVRLPALQLVGGVLLLILFWVGVKVIRSLGRAVRPVEPTHPTDATDLWAAGKVRQDLYPQDEPDTHDK